MFADVLALDMLLGGNQGSGNNALNYRLDKQEKKEKDKDRGDIQEYINTLSNLLNENNPQEVIEVINKNISTLKRTSNIGFDNYRFIQDATKSLQFQVSQYYLGIINDLIEETEQYQSISATRRFLRFFGLSNYLNGCKYSEEKYKSLLSIERQLTKSEEEYLLMNLDRFTSSLRSKLNKDTETMEGDTILAIEKLVTKFQPYVNSLNPKKIEETVDNFNEDSNSGLLEVATTISNKILPIISIHLLSLKNNNIDQSKIKDPTIYKKIMNADNQPDISSMFNSIALLYNNDSAIDSHNNSDNILDGQENQNEKMRNMNNYSDLTTKADDVIKMSYHFQMKVVDLS